MEEVEVVETVRRGWSGGTEEETQSYQVLFEVKKYLLLYFSQDSRPEVHL